MRLNDDGVVVSGCDHEGYEDFAWLNYSTCGGAITYTIRLAYGGEFFLTDEMSLSFYSVVYDGGEWHHLGCTTGVDCEAVVPEPITVVLLSTGLAGIGAVYRRRKKDELA